MTENKNLISKYAQRIFQTGVPTYLLSADYCVLDWNPAFEKIFAQPTNFKKGDFVGEFVKKLVDSEKIHERAAKIFALGSVPSVDVEHLQFQHPEFGLISFVKIAVQILNEEQDLAFWNMQFNIKSAEKSQEFWDFFAKAQEVTCH